jgi:hypothetical protein
MSKNFLWYTARGEDGTLVFRDQFTGGNEASESIGEHQPIGGQCLLHPLHQSFLGEARQGIQAHVPRLMRMRSLRVIRPALS